MRRLCLVAATLLAACTPGTPEQQPATSLSTDTPTQPQRRPQSQRVEARPVSHEEIFGQWRLVEMAGPQPDYPHEFHLLIGRYAIEAVSQCIPFGKVLPGAVVGPSPAPPRGNQAPVICARMISPTEQRFGRTLAAVRTIAALPDGRIVLRGDAGDLVLARSAQPVLNPFQNTPGPGPHLMWGEWRVTAINGRKPPDSMTLLFFKERLELGSGCVHFGRRMEQEGATLRLSPDPTVTTVCERMTSPEEDAAGRILSGELTIAQSAPRRRLLRGRNGTVVVER